MRPLWNAWLAKSSRPILLGPWRSEVGFEALYWLPWLQAWREREKIAKDRLVAIGRGGTGVWYDAGHVADLYDYVPLAKVRKAMLQDAAHTGSIKQLRIAEWEQTVAHLVAQDVGLRRYHLLHPSRMYQALAPWWEGAMPFQELLSSLKFMPVPVPYPPPSLALPERFIVAGFYARHTWPLTEELVDWVQALLTRLATVIPVVILESGLHADEHVPFPVSGPNILTLGSLNVAANLAVQSAVLARAQAFVGTYGGLMQLAVRLGKPSAGFYTEFTGTAYAHKHLTEWLGVQQKIPVFIGRREDARFLNDLLPK